MWLVLCHASDAAAAWAAEGLRRRGLRPLELVTAEDLACAARWRCSIAPSARGVDVRLCDGRHIDSGRVRGTLNRLQWVPADAVALGRPEDREYALQELYAFYMGWLYALPRPLLNPPTPQGLCGRWRYPSEWAWLAGQAGLPVRPLRITPDVHDWIAASGGTPRAGVARRTLIVLHHDVIGDAPASIVAGVEQLAMLAATPLLGVDFDVDDAGHWTFAGASVIPDLRCGGDSLLDRLEALFTEAA